MVVVDLVGKSLSALPFCEGWLEVVDAREVVDTPPLEAFKIRGSEHLIEL